MKTSKRSFLPTPAMVVALIALVSGLAGTAVALQGKNSVKSTDIAPKAVKSADIADHAVKGSKLAKDSVDGSNVKNGSLTAPDLDTIRSAVGTDTISTTSATPVDLGGPSVTVTVPEDGLVQLYAKVEANATGGGADAGARVHLYEATFLPDAPRIMQINKAADFQFRATTPGSGDGDGAAALTRGGMLILSPPAGTYTFSLRYSETGGGTALFRNRALYAGVIG